MPTRSTVGRVRLGVQAAPVAELLTGGAHARPLNAGLPTCTCVAAGATVLHIAGHIEAQAVTQCLPLRTAADAQHAVLSRRTRLITSPTMSDIRVQVDAALPTLRQTLTTRPAADASGTDLISAARDVARSAVVRARAEIGAAVLTRSPPGRTLACSASAMLPGAADSSAGAAIDRILG